MRPSVNQKTNNYLSNAVRLGPIAYQPFSIHFMNRWSYRLLGTRPFFLFEDYFHVLYLPA